MASIADSKSSDKDDLADVRKRKRRRVSSVPSGLDDVRIDQIGPLIPPCCLLEQLPLSESVAQVVKDARADVRQICHGVDDRLICIVGPCSVHDTNAAKEYAVNLRKLRQKYASELCIVMRVYFEKPRTTIGWKGLINDPDLDGTFNINKGLATGRKLLLDINELGVPCGCEFLDTLSPQWMADLVTWGAIGARTTESQVHRELVSGLSMTVGFKNSTSGNMTIASNALKSATNPHSFLSVTKQGLAAIVHTNGNPDVHVILRGGSSGPNYQQEHVDAAVAQLKKDKTNTRLMIDCSHGNSQKIHTNQPIVAEAVASQVAAGNENIIGVMIESNIKAGKQSFTPAVTPKEQLEYGKSITDACVDVPTTDRMLATLAAAVRTRREARGQSNGNAATN